VSTPERGRTPTRWRRAARYHRQAAGFRPHRTYDDLLRAPIMADHLARGLLTFLAYTLVFGSLAWARFTSKDVTC
jgi:hypothetical protein